MDPTTHWEAWLALTPHDGARDKPPDPVLVPREFFRGGGLGDFGRGMGNMQDKEGVSGI
jgi:hypothetical protein